MELYNIYFNIFTLPDFPNNSISIVLGILAVDQNLRESMVSCDLPCPGNEMQRCGKTSNILYLNVYSAGEMWLYMYIKISVENNFHLFRMSQSKKICLGTKVFVFLL